MVLHHVNKESETIKVFNQVLTREVIWVIDCVLPCDMSCIWRLQTVEMEHSVEGVGCPMRMVKYHPPTPIIRDWTNALLHNRYGSLADECDAYKQVCDGFAQQLQLLHSQLDFCVCGARRSRHRAVPRPVASRRRAPAVVGV